MYLAHYHLKVKPFQVTPDPKFIWLGESHREAFSVLKYSLLENRGLFLLVGDVGTGKTTLVNKLLESLSENTIVATVQYPGFEILDFYNFLSTSFNMGRRFVSKGDFLVRFIHFLHKSYAENRKILLIVDESQGLTDEILEEIRLLSNIERMNVKLLNIFLVGQNEVDQILARPENQALAQRITTRYYLGPIHEKEVKEYIRFRLKVAGSDAQIFNAGAIREIIESSKCYPRLINVICDHALLAGYIQGKTKIDAAIIRECAQEHQLQMIEAQTPRPMFQREPTIGERFKSWVGAQYLWMFPFILVFFLLMLVIAGYHSYLTTGEVASPPVVHLKPEPAPSAAEKEKKSDAQSAGSVNEKRKNAGDVQDKKKGDLQTSKSEFQEEDIGPDAGSQEKMRKQPLSRKNTNSTRQLKKTSGTKKDAQASSAALYAVDKLVVHFEAYSEGLDEDITEKLQQFLIKVVRYPKAYLLIKGYTDSSGKSEANNQLSLLRAEKVKTFFVDKGFDPDRITAVGLGEDDPVAPNDTVEGRNANRRIEIELIHD